jgi:hypothetical protein
MRTVTSFVVAGMLGCGGGSNPVGSTPPPPSNHAPDVIAAASATSLVMGQSTALSAIATDTDNDPLTYSWAQTSPASPQGTFSSLTSASPTWMAPTVAAVTPFILTVTVSDGHAQTPRLVKVFAKPSADPSFVADIQPFLVQCFGACHFAGGSQPMTRWGSLVVHWPEAPLPFCSGQPLVVPGDPDSSVLVKTLTGTSCGDQMPPGGPYLTTDQLAPILTWIQNGAPNN